MLQNGLIILTFWSFDQDGKLYTRFYDKCDDLPIVNLPYLSRGTMKSWLPLLCHEYHD